MPSRWFLHSWLTHFLRPPAPSTGEGQLYGQCHHGQLPSWDSGGPEKHMFLILLWLKQIKPDSLSSFSKKPSLTTPQSVQDSKLVTFRNFPSPRLVSTASPTPAQCESSMEWVCQWQCGRGCPLPTLGLFPSFPRCILYPPGSQVSPTTIHSVPTASPKYSQLHHSLVHTTPPHFSAASWWAQKGLGVFTGLSKAHRKLVRVHSLCIFARF